MLKEGRWVATADLSDVPVPPTISALLAARLDRLPTDERRLLDIASVMGQIFYPAAVRALAGGEPDGVGAGISALVRKQFIRPERSDLPETEALAFRHLLIRDAAYDAIPKATRAELHERFADVAGRRPADRSASRTRSSATTSSRRTATALELGADGRTRAAARRRGRSAPRGRRRTRVRAQRLLGVDQPPLPGVRVARSRRSDCGSASCRTSASALTEAGDMRRRQGRSSTRRSSEPSRSAMSRCACTPSSSDG